MHKKEMISCFIALGSNMGDRLDNMQRALRLIDEDLHCFLESCSPVYRSEAMYNEDLDYFYNKMHFIGTSTKNPM